MSDNFDDTDEQDEREPLDPKIREELRQARATRKELADAKAELDAQRRESAGIKAGLPDTPGARFFLEHYSGPMDAESIKSAAQEMGFLAPPPSGPSDEVQAELDQLRRAQGGVREQGDPQQEVTEAYYAQVRAAKNPADVIDAIVNAQRGGLPVRLATDQGRPN